jgi:nicotinate-nucleotide adenylyltransferase
VRLGILGGTFNPPHLGHLVCAQEAYRELELARVIFVVARIPPHKPVEEDPGAEHRLELCRRAVEEDDRFEVSDLELGREGPSYTVDTLEVLRSRAPQDDLYLILGGDIAAGLPSWHRVERVLELATPAIAKRRGTTRTTINAALQSLDAVERARFFEMPRMGISSTMMRERTAAGQSIRYLVPDRVAEYVRRHELYGGSHTT